MGKIKTDIEEFTTRRSLRELSDALRRAISATKAEVEKLEDDPLDTADDIKPDVQVLLSGSNFMGGPRMWGVQVLLYELGDRRAVQLIAIGEGFGAGVMSYYTGGYFELRDGKRRRDKILAILTENDPTVKKGIVLDDEPPEEPERRPEPVRQPEPERLPEPVRRPEPVKKTPLRGNNAEPDTSRKASGNSSGKPAGPSPTVQAPVSPDGVDPAASLLYRKMCENRSAVEGLTQEERDRIAYKLFALDCEKFAMRESAFPARSELMMIRGLETEAGTQERYPYQPYLDIFPDQQEAIVRGVNALKSWADSHQNDAFAALMRAGVCEALEDHEAANQWLYRVMLLEHRGVSVDDFLLTWINTAWASDFENWYVRRYQTEGGAKGRKNPETVAEPQVVEPQVAEPQVAEPQVAEPQVVEPPVIEPQAVEPPVPQSSGGAELGKASSVRRTEGRFCPHCGARVQEGAKFCIRCGKEVAPADPAAVVPAEADSAEAKKTVLKRYLAAGGTVFIASIIGIIVLLVS